jgi:hypothetical protein
MKLKTSELTKAALNWAVAKASHLELDDLRLSRSVVFRDGEPFVPDIYWELGGPIIEREWIELTLNTDTGGGEWVASIADDVPDGYHSATGATPLIAAMRCYVASKLGDTVDIPEELA